MAGGAIAAGPLVAASGASAAPLRARTARAGGKLVIGAFEDGALAPFKKKMIPLFKQQTGISIEFLTEPYDAFFAKAFNDGQQKSGAFDIYIMDDPWIPQYAAAGILEDLGVARRQGRRRLRQAVHRAGLLAAALGAAGQGLRERTRRS